VVSTEEVEIHPTSDLAPFIEGRLWDDLDIPALELITRAVHDYGLSPPRSVGYRSDRFPPRVTTLN